MTYSKELANNKRAFFDYFVEEKLECGIALQGSEVKSVRAGQMNIKESYVRPINEELWLVGCHIAPYPFAGRFNPDPNRDRKLLLHKKELTKLAAKVNEKGLTLMALRAYAKGNHIKLEIGLCRSKKQFDKRKTIKEKDLKREISRGLR